MLLPLPTQGLLHTLSSCNEHCACCAAVAAGILAVKRAVLTWAGNEQAGSVQLLSFLEANSQHWRRLPLPEPAATEPQLPPVLRAITRAAQLLYHSDLAHRLGSAVESAVAAVANTAADEPDGEEQQQQQQLGEVIDPMVLEAVRGGAAATQAELKIAQDIAKEVQVGPLCGCCAGVVKAIVQDSGVAP
jgi:hypothetical protein